MPIMARPPAPPIRASRRGELASQRGRVPAASAQALSLISAMPAKIAPSMMICIGTSPACRSTNCGSMAAKKTITFGLVTPTVNPSSTRRTAVLRSTARRAPPPANAGA